VVSLVSAVDALVEQWSSHIGEGHSNNQVYCIVLGFLKSSILIVLLYTRALSPISVNERLRSFCV
jgi:hypothetical protein